MKRWGLIVASFIMLIGVTAFLMLSTGCSIFPDVKINEKPVYVYAIDSEHAKVYQDNYSNKMLKYDLSSNGKFEKSYNESDEYYESKGYERIEWNKEDEVYYMDLGVITRVK